MSYSPETPNLGQIGRFSEPCDLDIWWMTLKNNREPLLSNIKLYASFHHHMWIQAWVTVRKRLSWVVTSVRGPGFARSLSMIELCFLAFLWLEVYNHMRIFDHNFPDMGKSKFNYEHAQFPYEFPYMYHLSVTVHPVQHASSRNPWLRLRVTIQIISKDHNHACWLSLFVTA